MKKICFSSIIIFSLLFFPLIFIEGQNEEGSGDLDTWQFDTDLDGNGGLEGEGDRLTPSGLGEGEDKLTPSGLGEGEDKLTPSGFTENDPTQTKEGDDMGVIYDIILSAADWFFTFLIALAVIVIVISGIMFVLAGGDPGKAATARNMAIYALIGVLVGSLGWALVNFIRSFFN